MMQTINKRRKKTHGVSGLFRHWACFWSNHLDKIASISPTRHLKQVNPVFLSNLIKEQSEKKKGGSHIFTFLFTLTSCLLQQARRDVGSMKSQLPQKTLQISIRICRPWLTMCPNLLDSKRRTIFLLRLPLLRAWTGKSPWNRIVLAITFWSPRTPNTAHFATMLYQFFQIYKKTEKRSARIFLN